MSNNFTLFSNENSCVLLSISDTPGAAIGGTVAIENKMRIYVSTLMAFLDKTVIVISLEKELYTQKLQKSEASFWL